MSDDIPTPDQQARISNHTPPELMIFTKLSDPLPRCLPDCRVVKDPDVLRAVAGMTDEEVMEWLDIAEGKPPGRSAALMALLKNPDAMRAAARMTEEEIIAWLDNIAGSQPTNTNNVDGGTVMADQPYTTEASDVTILKPGEKEQPVLVIMPDGSVVTQAEASRITADMTDEEMMHERLTAHPHPQDMIITKFGDPRPRLLPDNRIITDPDTIRAVAGLTDEEVMEWLDNIENSNPEDVE